MNRPQPDLEYHSEGELSEMFKKFAVLSDRMQPWQETKARKEHVDLFGEKIYPGQYYFKRTLGPSFHNVVKLSQKSLDRVLFALFAGNTKLRHIAEYLQERQLEEMREAFSKVTNPLSGRNTTP